MLSFINSLYIIYFLFLDRSEEGRVPKALSVINITVILNKFIKIKRKIVLIFFYYQ